jgi:hypothetical protein
VLGAKRIDSQIQRVIVLRCGKSDRLLGNPHASVDRRALTDGVKPVLGMTRTLHTPGKTFNFGDDIANLRVVHFG